MKGFKGKIKAAGFAVLACISLVGILGFGLGDLFGTEKKGGKEDKKQDSLIDLDALGGMIGAGVGSSIGAAIGGKEGAAIGGSAGLLLGGVAVSAYEGWSEDKKELDKTEALAAAGRREEGDVLLIHEVEALPDSAMPGQEIVLSASFTWSTIDDQTPKLEVLRVIREKGKDKPISAPVIEPKLTGGGGRNTNKILFKVPSTSSPRDIEVVTRITMKKENDEKAMVVSVK
jgi:outer membrane lipoprotein SlyB